jgi:tetratricopeptide (TPR) repeat protein
MPMDQRRKTFISPMPLAYNRLKTGGSSRPMKKYFAFTLSFILLLFLFVSSSAQEVQRIVIPPAQQTDRYHINLDLAKELIRAGKPEEAVNLINQLRDAYGDNEELIDLLKEAYLAGKEYDKVEEMIKKDLVSQPKNWMLYCELANVFLKTERREEAKLNLNKAIELGPNNEQTYREVAGVYMRNSFVSEAMDTYKSARMKIGQPTLFALDLASLYEALKDYKSAVDEYFLFMGEDTTKFDVVEDRINRLIQSEENLDQIQLALSERIQKKPQDRYYQKLYGDLLFRRKDLTGAFESYKKVDALFGDKGRFILTFIQMCYNQKYFERAIQASQYLLSTNPPKEPALLSAKLFMARSYEGMERFTAATDVYQEIIDNYTKLNPAEERLFRKEIAFSYFQIGEINLFQLKRPDEALSSFQKVVSNYRDSDWYPDALVGLSDCIMAKGDLDSAQALLQIASDDPRAESKKEEMEFKLTEIEFFKGNFDEALTGYNQVVADFPKGLFVNNSLERIIVIGENQELDRPLLSVFASSMLNKLQGKSDSAIFKLDRIISAKSEKLTDLAFLEKGKIYNEEKKFSESLEAFQKLLEKYPQSLFCDQAQKLIGDVYNYGLKDKTKAIEAYQKLLKDYGRSVYSDEVRDKLRELKAGGSSG